MINLKVERNTSEIVEQIPNKNAVPIQMSTNKYIISQTASTQVLQITVLPTIKVRTTFHKVCPVCGIKIDLIMKKLFVVTVRQNKIIFTSSTTSNKEHHFLGTG